MLAVQLLQIDDYDMIDVSHNRNPLSLASAYRECPPRAELHASLSHYARCHLAWLHGAAAEDAVNAATAQGEKPVVVLQGVDVHWGAVQDSVASGVVRVRLTPAMCRLRGIALLCGDFLGVRYHGHGDEPSQGPWLAHGHISLVEVLSNSIFEFGVICVASF